MSTTDPSQASVHSCEHCSGSGGAAPDPAAQANSHLALAQRRLVPRIVLGVLGVGVAVVIASNNGQRLGTMSVAAALAILAWLAAAWGGFLLGALLTRGRGQSAQVALGQVMAASLAGVLALGSALVLGPWLDVTAWARVDGETSPLMALVPVAVAAASGWFFAASIGELVRLRSLRSAVGRQDDLGALARGEATRLTQTSIQRSELVALGVALAFGIATAALVALPWLAVVIIPLAAAGAAWLGLRPLRQERAAEAQRAS